MTKGNVKIPVLGLLTQSYLLSNSIQNTRDTNLFGAIFYLMGLGNRWS
jgi:hypothetical protein